MLVDGDGEREKLLLGGIFVVGEHELAQALRLVHGFYAELTLLDGAVEDV